MSVVVFQDGGWSTPAPAGCWDSPALYFGGIWAWCTQQQVLQPHSWCVSNVHGKHVKGNYTDSTHTYKTQFTYCEVYLRRQALSLRQEFVRKMSVAKNQSDELADREGVIRKDIIRNVGIWALDHICGTLYCKTSVFFQLQVSALYINVQLD